MADTDLEAIQRLQSTLILHYIIRPDLLEMMLHLSSLLIASGPALIHIHSI